MAKWQYCEVSWDQEDDIYVTIAGTTYVNQKIAHGEAEWPKVLAMLGEDEWDLIGTLADGNKHWYHFKRPLHNFYEGKVEAELLKQQKR